MLAALLSVLPSRRRRDAAGSRVIALLLALVVLRAAPAAAAGEDSPWPDTFVARVEVLALMQSLNAAILASPTATRALESWCAEHGLAADPRVTVRPLAVPAAIAAADTLARLGASRRETIAYRSVELRCGEVVLSKTENWYLPDRLPRALRRTLATTDTPFGRAVQSLSPYRRTISAGLLWQPLPKGWERDPAVLDLDQTACGPPAASLIPALEIPQALFEQRAVVYSGKHVPLAEVHEVYQRGILGSPAPRTP